MNNNGQEEFVFVEEQVCNQCKISKSIEDFFWNCNKSKKAKRKVCILCLRLRNQNWYKKNSKVHILKAKHRKDRNREFIHEYKVAHSCIQCGESDPLVLDFDHRDPSKKSFGICDSVHNGRSLEKIQEEIDKCDMLCANCHRRKTAKQLRYFSYKVLYEGFKYNPNAIKEFKAEMVE